MQSKCLIIPPPPPPPPLPCRYTIWVERRFKKGGGAFAPLFFFVTDIDVINDLQDVGFIK